MRLVKLSRAVKLCRRPDQHLDENLARNSAVGFMPQTGDGRRCRGWSEADATSGIHQRRLPLPSILPHPVGHRCDCYRPPCPSHDPLIRQRCPTFLMTMLTKESRSPRNGRRHPRVSCNWSRRQQSRYSTWRSYRQYRHI